MASVEVMTACENVCRDFGSWLPVLTSVLADLATIIAVLIAAYAANEWSRWKRQTIAHRVHDVALDAIEELRAYGNRLNAARMCPTNAAISSFDNTNFEDANAFLQEAMESRTEVIRLCELANDLGPGAKVKELSARLVHDEAKVRRHLRKARHAYDRDNVDGMCTHLGKLFWRPGAETALDQELSRSQTVLREALLKLIRFSD